ncbi:MAG: bifunctional DNA-formamidopyrimidine glycosylase/DNA-(apurinic or apyrimidinic site) lyase [Acidobacteria bacterium]|nr:bifunctional DNA-formamidopyrimidine glycosylase/DNA-(apurinic or apyrimidinic site) lyase [Acidobacteriota bacterium]
MPELPEVETVVRSLRPLLAGRRITAVELPSQRANGSGGTVLRRLLHDPVEEFQKGLCGARVREIRRHGKNILITLQRDGKRPAGSCLLVHLGMTGRLQFEASPEPLRPHTHVIFSLDSPGCWLHFSDPRRFGKLRLLRNGIEYLETLGPDPTEISGEEFYARLHPRKAMLKSLLLDQHFLRGLGNIYADESLSRAGLHPAAIGGRLRRPQVARLYEAIRETLRQAIELGGSSISDYVDAQGRSGWFQQAHQVYGRTGEPCFRCGSRIRRMVIVSRSTHFCPRCQQAGKPRGRKAAAPGKRAR